MQAAHRPLTRPAASSKTAANPARPSDPTIAAAGGSSTGGRTSPTMTAATSTPEAADRIASRRNDRTATAAAKATSATIA